MKRAFYTIDGTIIAESTGGVRTDYMHDALGSVIGTVDSTGTVTNTYRWKPYGSLLSSTGPNATPTFGWLGGLGYRAINRSHADYYVRARTYSAVEGTWLSLEPLWPIEPAFLYSSSNPLSLVDPTGLGGELPVPGDTARVGASGPARPCTCFECAEDWAWNLWRTKLHKCHHLYIHCYVCCRLAGIFGPNCAIAAQKKQNATPFIGYDVIAFGKGVPGVPDYRLVRITTCQWGAYPKAACHEWCLTGVIYGHKIKAPNNDPDCKDLKYPVEPHLERCWKSDWIMTTIPLPTGVHKIGTSFVND